MVLPSLPKQEILPMFEQLRQQATTAPLQQFVAYVSDTWISNRTWPPSSWSVYMMAIRSNNDVQGWHHGLHRRAAGRQNLNLYLLIDLLHQEALLNALHIRLVSEKKLTRMQRTFADYLRGGYLLDTHMSPIVMGKIKIIPTCSGFGCK